MLRQKLSIFFILAILSGVLAAQETAPSSDDPAKANQPTTTQPTTQPTSQPTSQPQVSPPVTAAPKSPAYEWVGKPADRPLPTTEDAVAAVMEAISRDRDLVAGDPTLSDAQKQELDLLLVKEVETLDRLSGKWAKTRALDSDIKELQERITKAGAETREINAKLANPNEIVWERAISVSNDGIPALLKEAEERHQELKDTYQQIKNEEFPRAETVRKEWGARVEEAENALKEARKKRTDFEQALKDLLSPGAKKSDVVIATERVILERLTEAFQKAHRDYYKEREDKGFNSVAVQERQAAMQLADVQSRLQARVINAIEKESRRIAAEALAQAQKDRRFWDARLAEAREKPWIRPFVEEKLRSFDIDGENQEWLKIESEWKLMLSDAGPIHFAIEELEKLQSRIKNTDSSEIDVEERLPDDTALLRSLVKESADRRTLFEQTRRDLTALFATTVPARRKSAAEVNELDARMSAAEQSERNLALGKDGAFTHQPAEWLALSDELRTRMKARTETIERLRASIKKWDGEIDGPTTRARETVQVLERRLLWTRERTDISLASVKLAFDHLTKLQDGLVPYGGGLARAVRDHVKDPENSRSLLSGAVMLIALLLIGRMIHRRLPQTCTWMEAHAKGPFGKVVLVISTVLRQTEFAFLSAVGLAAVPAVVGFPTRVTVPLAILFVTPFAYRFLHVLIDIAIAPRPERLIRVSDELATILYRAGRYGLKVAAAFFPLGLWLEYGGYETVNPGFVQLYWLVFRILFNGVLFLTILRPAVIAHMIRGKGELAMTVKTSIVLAYPIIVSIVFGLFLLGSLRYREAEQYFRLLVLKSAGVLFLATLVYQVVMRRVFPDREYSMHISPDEFPEAADFEAEGRRRFYNRFQRLLVRTIIFVPAIVMVYRLWPPIPEAILHGSVFRKEGGVTLRDMAVAVFVVWATFVGLRYFREGLKFVVMPNFRIDPGLRYTVITLCSYALLAVGLIAALNILRVEGDQIAWIVSALAVGIGFGLQSIVKNFVSGLILLVERPLNVGDSIVAEGQVGKVEQITMRATTLLTADGKSIIIPNEKMIDAPLVNESMGPPRIRSSVMFGVAYGSDTKAVRKTALEVVQSHGLILKRPEIEVLFIGFGESSLDFEIRYWTAIDTHRGRVSSDIRFALDAAFRRLGVEMPFPQRDLHVRSVDPSILERLKRDDATAFVADAPNTSDRP